MKKMIITASALGAVIAGAILYLQKRIQPGNKIADETKGGFKKLNEASGSVEQPASL